MNHTCSWSCPALWQVWCTMPTFTCHTSVTWPFQHFRCVSAVFVFLYPPLSLTPQLPGLSNTSGVYLQSLFFCTHFYLSHFTYWPLQHFRCVSAVFVFLYIPLPLTPHQLAFPTLQACFVLVFCKMVSVLTSSFTGHFQYSLFS